MATVASVRMQPSGHMTHLTTAAGSFHGRVLAARLGAAGILVELRGLAEGPYPLPGKVEVYVRSDQIDAARELLLADAVDAAFEERAADLELGGGEEEHLAEPDATAWHRRPSNAVRIVTLLMVVLLVVVGVVASFH